MKTNTSTRTAFFSVRVLFAFALCASAALLAFSAWRVPASSEHVRIVTDNTEVARALPTGGDSESEPADLLRLEEYRHNRLAYPTGRFDPAWVRRAADQHNRNQRGTPGGKTLFASSTGTGTTTLTGATPSSGGDATDFSGLAVGPLSLSSTSFTSLGPKPENMTGCGATCFDYGVTAGRINTITMDPTTTTNGSIVAYAGSDGGGVWKTTNCCTGSTTWTVTTDDPLISSIAISSITIDPSNHNVIYAGTGDGDGGGSPSGSSQGILKSTDGGATWVVLAPNVFGAAYSTPVGNFPQYDSVTKVRVDPNNSSKVVAATKRGLFFSYDAGTNWTGPCTTNNFASQRQEVTSLELTNMGGGVTRILAAVGVRGFGVSVRPDLANNGANGIYKANMTASGCPSFTSTASNANGFKFGTAVSGSPYTTGANMNAGTGTAYVSTSTGNQLSRIDLGVAPSNPNVIYAQAASIAANSATGCGSTAGCQLGAWSSTDGGATWSFMTGSAGGSLRQCASSGAGSSTAGSGDYGQNWYDQGVIVDPNNADRVFFDTYDVWLATRTGTQWYDLSCAYSQTSQKVHADQHALAFAPGSSSILVIGNDGGIHATTAANTAANDSVRPAFFNMDGGLNTIEYYAGDIAGDINGAGFATASQPRAAGGAQDNMDSVVLFSGSPTGPVQWTGTVGGDGFYARIDAKGGYVYVSNNSGQIHRCTGGNSCFSNPISWSGDLRASAMTTDNQSFVMPFDIFKGNPGGSGNAECGTRCNHMIVGTYRVWETLASDGGTISWSARTADLTKNINSAVSYINEVAYAPATQTLGVAGTFDGNVQLVLGLGGTATTVNLTDSNNVLPNRAVTKVAFDPLSDNTAAHLISVYATVAGFDANTPSQPGHVFRADCANVNCTSFTWTNKTGNLPDIPADSVLANPNFPQQVFVGTEFGLYFTDDITQNPPTWYRFDNGIPHARISSLRTDRGNTTLSVWTASRGAYVYPLPTGPANGSFGTLQGTVTDASTNAPIAGATVTAQSNSTTTDANGFYQFPSIGATTYNMSAIAAGYLQNSVANVVVSANQTTTQNIKLTAAPATACLTDTTQTDFDNGTKTNVETSTSPGDVKLARSADLLDATQTNTGNTQGLSVSTTIWTGNTFTPSTSGQISKLDAAFFNLANLAGGSVIAEIRAVNPSTNLPTGAAIATATFSISGTASGFYTATFSSPATVTAGTRYAFSARTTSGSCAINRRANGGADYAAGNAVQSTNSGGAWAFNDPDVAFDIYISTGFQNSGNLVSSLKDSNPAAGSSQRWTTLSWTGSAPANTTLTFQVAASNNAAGPFNFVGPNNTNAANDVFANGASLSQFNGNRYLKYKAFFTTTNSSATPALNDVTVCYNNTPKQNQTINFPAIADKTYGDADIDPNATASSGLTVSVNVVGNCSIVAGKIHITGAGSCTATATQAGNDFYFAAPSVQRSFNIGKRDASWTTNPNSKTYGSADPNPLTTGSGTGFLPADNVSATYSRDPGETVAGGPYHITASLSPAGLSNNYNITNDGADFTITKKNATWTTNNNSKTYGATDPNPLTTGSGSGFVGSDNITATYTRDAGETVAGGPYHITATLSPTAALDNYNVTNNGGSFSINRAHLTVTADSQSKPYDGSVFTAFTAVISGFVNGENATVVSGSPGFTGSATTAVNAGTYTITPTVGTLSAANYDFTSFVNGTLTISKVHLTVTANDKSRAYGAANPTFTATLSGFVNSETDSGLRAGGKLTGAPTFSGTGPSSTGTTMVGDYVITPAAGTLSATNYDFPALNFVDGTLTITKAHLTVTADDKNKTYNGAGFSPFTATLIGFANGETEGGLRASGALTGSAGFTGTATAAVNAGTYVITPTPNTLSATNYDFAVFNNGSLTINKVHLTVTADNQNKPYDGTAFSPFTATITGFVNNESAAEVSGSPGFAGNAVGAVNAGSYTITPTLGTLGATNYDFPAINFIDGTLLISKVPLTVTANDKSRAYGSANPTFAATLTGFVNNETESSLRSTGKLSGSPGFSGTGPASTPSTTVGDYVITPAIGTLAATNYDFPPANFVDGTLTITKAHLTVTADDKSRTYGAANPTFTATLTGFANGETDAGLRSSGALSGSAEFSGTGPSSTPASTVGDYVITPAAGTLSATNYDFNSFVDGTLHVTKAQLTVTPQNKSKDYDGAVYSPFTAVLSGFVNGETDSGLRGSGALSGAAGFSGSATTAVNAGTYTITPTQNTLSATNYDFTVFSNGTLNIYKVHLTVTANNKSKTYNGSAFSPFTATITGFVNNETAAVVSGSPGFTGTAVGAINAGSYTITPTQGTLGATNYDFTVFNSGTLVIYKVHLTVSADNKSKLYNGSPYSPLTATLTGFVNSETDAGLRAANALSGAASYTGSAVGAITAGTYTIIPTQGTLAATNYDFTVFNNGTLTIGTVTLTVKADNKSRQYSDPNPTLTYTVTGFVNGETSAVLSGTPNLTTSATLTSPVGTYPITVAQGTLSATNYIFSFVNGTLTLTKETASLLYTGDSLVATKTAGGKATVNLAALVTEEADGSLGNTLGGNSIKFSVYKSTNTSMATADYVVTGVIDGVTRVALASLGNLSADNYIVKVELIATNYSAELDNGVFTVVDPTTGVINGGGWVNDPEGGRGHLGFTSKFVKGGVPQGNNIYIHRKVMDLAAMGIVGAPSGPRAYDVVYRSNAMSAMTASTTTTPKTGSFSGKTSIKAVDRLTGAMYNLSPTVNQSFQVDVTDKSDPSSATNPDTYALRVWTTTGNYKIIGTYSAGGANTSQVPLQGGNLQVK